MASQPSECLPGRSGKRAGCGTTWPSIWGAFAAAIACCAAALTLGHRLVGLAMVRSGALIFLTDHYPIPAQMPAISSSATPTIKNASQAGQAAATKPNAAAK